MASSKWTRWLVLALVVPLAPVYAASPVWTIEKNGSRMYLAGSVHFLSAEDYPLPAAFDEAYRQSEVMVFETDIQKMQSPEGSQRIIQRLSYDGGRSLREDISDATYASLRDFFNSRGVPMTQIDQFRPGMVSMMISIVELQSLGLAGEGVDVFLNRRALSDQRQRLQLESIDQQIDFLASMGGGREDELLNYTLQEAKRIGNLMAAIKRAWRSGNLGDLQQLVIEPMETEFPRIHQSLLTRRNHDWLPRFEKMLASRKTEFVVVGAAHLVGNEGLLNLLRQRGYRVEQLP